jgi:CBS-domain-containing membrane protein
MNHHGGLTTVTRTLGRLSPLTVADVMTVKVVTVGESATFHEMTLLLKKHGISALPVTGSDGALLGIVSEADLLLKEAPPLERSRRWPWSRHQGGGPAKAEAARAGDVMTRMVVTITPRSTLATAARLMREYGVKRLPVVDGNGALIGITSRRDLLTAFTRSDEEIRHDIVEGVMPGWLGIAPEAMTVAVEGGVVSLRGTLARRSDVDAVEHVVAYLDGVVQVDAKLAYEFDDQRVSSPREVSIG